MEKPPKKETGRPFKVKGSSMEHKKIESMSQDSFVKLLREIKRGKKFGEEELKKLRTRLNPPQMKALNKLLEKGSTKIEKLATTTSTEEADGKSDGINNVMSGLLANATKREAGATKEITKDENPVETGNTSPENVEQPNETLSQIGESLMEGKKDEADEAYNAGYKKSEFAPTRVDSAQERKERKEKLQQEIQIETTKTGAERNPEKIKELTRAWVEFENDPEETEESETKETEKATATTEQPISTTPEPEEKPIKTEDTNKGPEQKHDDKNKQIEDTIKKYIESLGIETSPEFKALAKEQQLLIMESLMRKVVDVIKGDAETQYSTDLQSKMVTASKVEAGEGAGKGKKFLTGLQNISHKVGAGFKNAGTTFSARFKKEFTIKDLELKSFDNLKNNEEGKKFIKETLDQLVGLTKERTVKTNSEGKPIIDFTLQLGIENPTEVEKNAIEAYNEAANNWREIPYEWGQETKEIITGETKHKKLYEKAKGEYETAKEEILKIRQKRENPEEKGKAMVEMIQMSKMLELDQLMNTHPEFEKEFSNLIKAKGIKQLGEFGMGSLKTISGGGKLVNYLLFAGGMGLRTAARGSSFLIGGGSAVAAWSSAIAAPVIGATVGYFKGYVKGTKTLKERDIQARHGKKDENKEARNVIDAEILTKKMDALLKDFESTVDPKTKEEKLKKLRARINYTREKLEEGLINFGDARISQGNQIRFIETLNNAVVVSSAEETQTKNELNERLESFLSARTERISEDKMKFIKKQALWGAAIGSGAATAGYAVKYLLEVTGGAENISEYLHEVGEKSGLNNVTRWIGEHMPRFGHGGAGGESSSEVLTNGPHTVVNGGTAETTLTDGTKIFTPLKGGPVYELKNGQMILMPQDTIPRAGGGFDVVAKGGVGPVQHFDSNGNLMNITDPSGNIIPGSGVTPRTTGPIPNPWNQQPNGQNQYTGPWNQQPTGPATPAATPAATPGAAHTLDKEFTVTLGKDGVPQHLETAFTSISANHLELPSDGVIDEEFASKSLNMGANLVRLSEGHGVAGISAEEFKNAVSFKNGVLEIKDHNAFNDILDKLKVRADESWDNGVLQGKGAAAMYLRNISHDTWVNKIGHADGMHSAGIAGHADATAKDFSNSDIVKNATIPKGSASDLASQQIDPTTGRPIGSLADQQIDPTTGKYVGSLAGQQIDPTTGQPTDLANQQIDPTKAPTGPAKPTMGQVHGAQEIEKMAAPIEGEVAVHTIPPPEDYISPKELVKIEKVNAHNIHKMFHGHEGRTAWENIKSGHMGKSAKDILNMGPEEIEAHPSYAPLVDHLSNLKEVTGLSPLERNVLHPDEPIDKFMIRATKRAYKMGGEAWEKVKL